MSNTVPRSPFSLRRIWNRPRTPPPYSRLIGYTGVRVASGGQRRCQVELDPEVAFELLVQSRHKRWLGVQTRDLVLVLVGHQPGQVPGHRGPGFRARDHAQRLARSHRIHRGGEADAHRRRSGTPSKRDANDLPRILEATPAGELPARCPGAQLRPRAVWNRERRGVPASVARRFIGTATPLSSTARSMDSMPTGSSPFCACVPDQEQVGADGVADQGGAPDRSHRQNPPAHSPTAIADQPHQQRVVRGRGPVIQLECGGGRHARVADDVGAVGRGRADGLLTQGRDQIEPSKRSASPGCEARRAPIPGPAGPRT